MWPQKDADSEGRVNIFTDIDTFLLCQKAQRVYADLILLLGANLPAEVFFQQDIDMDPNWH